MAWRAALITSFNCVRIVELFPPNALQSKLSGCVRLFCAYGFFYLLVRYHFLAFLIGASEAAGAFRLAC